MAYHLAFACERIIKAQRLVAPPFHRRFGVRKQIHRTTVVRYLGQGAVLQYPASEANGLISEIAERSSCGYFRLYKVQQPSAAGSIACKDRRTGSFG